jgi:hypothetical protein
MGQHCPTECEPILSERENTVSWLAFKLDTAMAAAENWDSKYQTLTVKREVNLGPSHMQVKHNITDIMSVLSHSILNQRIRHVMKSTCMLQGRICWTEQSSITQKMKQLLQKR